VKTFHTNMPLRETFSLPTSRCDLAASLRERELRKTRTRTPAQLREKARAEWLEFRNA
jgi:hypothetical protein